MLKSLKFVQGAVSKKDFVPAMTHFEIKDSNARAYNGHLTISCPIPFDIDCKPRAAPLVQAIACCSDTAALSMTAAGRLRVQSGNFKAFIECHDGETPLSEPEGEIVVIDGEKAITALKALSCFVGDDASRPWSNGILIKGQSAFATNNICLVEYWLHNIFPFEINIPLVAIKEVLRVPDVPVSIQATDKSITFHYTDGRWIKSHLLSNKWPDLSRILNCAHNAAIVDERIFEAMDFLNKFTDDLGRIYFTDQQAKTCNQDEEGAIFDLEGFAHEGIYQIGMLKLLKGIVTKIDFSAYPNPCMFFGNRLRGAIIGIVQ